MRRWLLLAAAAALGACAQLPFLPVGITPQGKAWALREAALQDLQHWTLLGRIAVQNGKQGFTAGLRWVQDGPAYQLRLMAPLGQGTYELQGDPKGVTLRTADNRVLQAADPNALMQDNLGWSAPVAGLRYWVLGVPEPGVHVDYLRVDDQGRLTDLEQAGWRISVLDYRKAGSLVLPSKLYMQNDTLELRMVVQSWEIAKAS